MAIRWRWQDQRKINGVRTEDRVLRPQPPRGSGSCPPPRRTPVAAAARLSRRAERDGQAERAGRAATGVEGGRGGSQRSF